MAPPDASAPGVEVQVVPIAREGLQGTLTLEIVMDARCSKKHKTLTRQVASGARGAGRTS